MQAFQKSLNNRFVTIALKVAHEARLVELKAATKAAQVDINMNQGKLFQKSKNKPNNKEERKLVLQQAEILERETKIAQESVLVETQSRLDTLKLKASSFASTRAELTNIFSKILLLSPKPDETYASNLLTRTVAQFYKDHLNAQNMDVAMRHVHRGIQLLQKEKGTEYEFTMVGTQAVERGRYDDVSFGLYFMGLAQSAWPRLRKLGVPTVLEQHYGYKAVVQAMLRSAQGYLVQERNGLYERLNRSYAAVIQFSANLESVRHAVLNELLIGAGMEDYALSIQDFATLFARDVERIEKWANLKEEADSEEDIGKAVGLFYLDLDVGFRLELLTIEPPAYSHEF
ncbi:hypothetical protein HDU79_007691 [Rhizoclosmatium sp. JEL0117]|nr:hypothetical protein HDU79_007691 [Rhizoclosmatium sp. JEL0117]